MTMYDYGWVQVRSAELIREAEEARLAKEAARRPRATARRQRRFWRLTWFLVGAVR